MKFQSKCCFVLAMLFVFFYGCKKSHQSLVGTYTATLSSDEIASVSADSARETILGVWTLAFVEDNHYVYMKNSKAFSFGSYHLKNNQLILTNEKGEFVCGEAASDTATYDFRIDDTGVFFIPVSEKCERRKLIFSSKKFGFQNPQNVQVMGFPGFPAQTNDLDRDGVDDSLEDLLGSMFEPRVFLHPSEEYFPASVDWFLPRVRMSFDHAVTSVGTFFCSNDHPVLPDGAVNQDNIYSQSHRKAVIKYMKGIIPYCTDAGDLATSDQSISFYLNLSSDDYYHGTTNRLDWRMYRHVRKSITKPDGWDVQYWFFYPYNDDPVTNPTPVGGDPSNHEGDWEHVTFTIDNPDLNHPDFLKKLFGFRIYAAFYSAHEGGMRIDNPAELEYDDPNRLFTPIVYSAKGTHASYPHPGIYPLLLGFNDHAAGGGLVFFQGFSKVNMGEKGHPLFGNNFILFAGRWGEPGARLVPGKDKRASSAPQGPATKPSWDNDYALLLTSTAEDSL